ncbi:hypothetical protein EDC39_105185 [Geothermobacter ehrlichii]|uniref:Uncharacterized protein n=1 Tax=Geothermobacter ehrlichii TaxID=213224 RepID=A0A5D3WMP4_9BACT|nr:hypothetical protein [Geothermobacter ehrlichii]TYO98816.1 hypothetical protein EDC39_105185 [Geothermobacter ehrlichii]
MFRQDPNRTRLGIPAQQVLRLEESISDAQVSVPGYPSQMARAYLCVFQTGSGLRVTVVLHLLTSNRLVFFLNSGGPLGKDDACRVLGEGMQFAESLGFMLGNLDFHRLSPAERQELWNSLPLEKGLAAASPSRPASAAERENGPSVEEPPALRTEWTVEEMQLKRRRFIENLGRLLAML